MYNKKLVILDAFSTLHVGNGILLDQSIAVVNDIFKIKEISILSIDPDTVKLSKKNVYADIFADFPRDKGVVKKIIWSLKFFFLMLFWLSGFSRDSLPKSRIYSKKVNDFVDVINSGDIFLSISGETINSTFFPRMIMRCIIMWILGLKGKEVIIFPQSIGPLTKNYHKNLVKFFLSRVKRAYARDFNSFHMAKELFGDKRALLSPDVGVYSGTTYPEFKRVINKVDSNSQYEKLIIGIAVSMPPNEINIPKSLNNDIGKTLCSIFESKDVEFLLLPSNFSKNTISGDYSECVKLMELLKNSNFKVDILPNKIIEPREYAQYLADVDFFLSTRMHVAILSTSLGIPTVAFNTQNKILGYMSIIKMDEYVISVDELDERLSKVLSDLIDIEVRKSCSVVLNEENGMRIKDLMTAISKVG